MDRALGSGISIPQWMKGKPVGGFDPSTMSPPTYDDDFFQIRYNKQGTDLPTPGYRKLGDVLKEQVPARPHGVDDGFHGPKSACASTVVAVAQRMLRLQPPSPSHPRLRQRRNSKSLPTSPLGSPEARRRLGNRFFTLDESRATTGSSSSILDALNKERDASAAMSTQDLSRTVEVIPQPSELREMNFWSPTSM